MGVRYGGIPVCVRIWPSADNRRRLGGRNVMPDGKEGGNCTVFSAHGLKKKKGRGRERT